MTLYTLLDHKRAIDDFINKKESYKPSELGGVEGVHFDNSTLDGDDIVHISKAEREVAVFIVHYAFQTIGSNILLKGTKGFREIIEELGIGYFDECLIKYNTGDEKVRNFVVGKLCTLFGVQVQDVNNMPYYITADLMALATGAIREETRSKFSY